MFESSDFLVLHDSGFISNLSWASASKKYHKNEWSEKWNKGKQTHKMQASVLLLVCKDKVKFIKLLETFLNDASQKAWSSLTPLTALGWRLHLGLSDQVRATILSWLLLQQSFWWSPNKDLQNPKCSTTGLRDDHTIQMSRLLKTHWRRVPSPPVSQQIVFQCINQSNHNGLTAV